MNERTTARRGLIGAALLAQGLLLAGHATAGEEDTTARYREYEDARESVVPLNGSKGFDAVAVRPTTFFTSLVSSAVFVVSLPFTALDPAIGAGKATENLVEYPFNDTFRRPLGDLDAMGAPSGNP